MLNLLVITNNLNFLKILINNILQFNCDIRLCYIAISEKEALSYIERNGLSIDVILLNISTITFKVDTFLDFLERDFSDHFKSSIIFISEDLNLSKNTKKNPLFFTCIEKNATISNIFKKLNLLVDSKNKINYIKKCILNELSYLGYNSSHKGTQYLVDIISIFYFSKNQTNLKLKKDIYPILSTKYNTNENNIKMNISKATEYMYYENEELKIKNYFHFYLEDKPKPKLVISTIVNKLKYSL